MMEFRIDNVDTQVSRVPIPQEELFEGDRNKPHWNLRFRLMVSEEEGEHDLEEVNELATRICINLKSGRWRSISVEVGEKHCDILAQDCLEMPLLMMLMLHGYSVFQTG